MKIPKYTVLLPVFKPNQYFPRALESISSDIDTTGELLILDDGNDPPLSSQYDFTQYEFTCRVIRNEKNLGLPKTLNLGLQEAQGEIIIRMDADDENVTGRCQVLVSYLNQHSDISLLCPAFEIMDENANILYRPPLLLDDLSIKHGLILEGVIPHAPIAYRKTPILNHGGYDEDFFHADDYALFIKHLPHLKFAGLNDIYYKILKYDDSFTGKTRAQRQKKMLDLKNRNLQAILNRERYEIFFPDTFFSHSPFDWAPETCRQEELKKYYAHLLYRLGLLFLKKNQLDLAQKLFQHSLELGPTNMKAWLMKKFCCRPLAPMAKSLLSPELF